MSTVQCTCKKKRHKNNNYFYTKAIKATNTTERDRALTDLEKEKEARQKAEEREACVLL